ncbi:MAG: hypothetical protein H6728_13775 [Myxococcales bacterium]|nr:hypothetical protein [Myxococcales bacterium]MCB9644139.1 hypothetical protein [Myxococcales bacterium]
MTSSKASESTNNPTSQPALRESLEQLHAQFISHFPETLRGPRTIGREAEYPIVQANGEAADIRALWPHLMEAGDLKASFEKDELIVSLEGKDYSYAMEVGWGTIEVITGPCPDLNALKQLHEAAMTRLTQAADRCGYLLLGYGVQPLTPPSGELMSPKQRYHVLHDVIGPTWQWFTATASDQVQIDISREELVPLLNLTNLLSPVVVALCANSPICAGEESGWLSAREGMMGQIHASSFRHGMPERPMRDALDWIETLARQQFLVRREDGTYHPETGTFLDYLEKKGPSFEDFLMHEHYIWNSGRPRCAHATIELRAACQQPWKEHMATSALGLGIIEAWRTIQDWLQEQVKEPLWPLFHEYHKRVQLEGLQAQEPFDGMIAGVLQCAKDALEARGFGEAAYLAPLFRRLHERRSPGHDAIEAYKKGRWETLRDVLTCSLER